MKPPEEVRRELVGRWLHKAGEDLAVSQQLAAQGQFPSSAAFHAQQAAEKYLKALLVQCQIEFPKTHDLGRLLDLIGTFDAELAGSLTDVRLLSQYGVEHRYPVDAPELTPAEAAEAVELARQARDRIARWLAEHPDD